MMPKSNYVRRRLLKIGLSGGLSGLAAFAVLEPITRAQGEAAGKLESLSDMAIAFALFGLIVSFGFSLGEEFGSWDTRRIGNRALRAVAVGLIGGLAAGFLGQLSYLILKPLSFLTVVQVFRRTVAWAIVGGTVGIAIGVAAGSSRKSGLGLIGGLIGGGLGGLVFDAAAQSYGDTAGRLMGMTCVGLFAGLGIALVEELAKQAWIVVLVGRNEGREYILSKTTTSVGRDELADIPLYGDPTVQRLHCAVEKGRSEFIFRDIAGGATVNNQPFRETTLHHGDVIRVGKFELSFRTKGQHRAPSASVSPAQIQPSRPRLQVTAGPRAGRLFDISNHTVSIGRAASNTIVFDQDLGVSRSHATIRHESGYYIVRDLGSANGTFVNGVRVTEASLNTGDTLRFGNTSVVFLLSCNSSG